MNNPLVKRLIGLVFFGVGVGLAIWLKNVHDTGGTIEDRAIIFTPILLLIGLTAMVFPNVLISRQEYATAPLSLRLLSILIAIVGGAIGVWLRFVIFKDWVPVR